MINTRHHASESEILFYAINEASNQAEVTSLAMQIHRVCPSGSDTETELIRRIAAKQIELELIEMDRADQIQARRLAIVENWRQN